MRTTTMTKPNHSTISYGIPNAIIRWLLFAVIVAFPFELIAQAPWAQSGNDIQNTNSGNVGTGALGSPDLEVCATALCGAGNSIAVGNDVIVADLDTANTMGINGTIDSTVASIKLGTAGGTISGYSGNVGIGTTN